MVLEVAVFRIHPGQGEPFEAAFRQASQFISQAPGYLGHELQRGIENPAGYLLFVRWQTVEDHMTGFRTSPLFGQWRALLQPFFAEPSKVEHYTLAYPT